MFWTILGVAIVRVSIYSIWASGDIQPWNNPNELKSTKRDVLTRDIENHTAKSLLE